MKAFRISTVLAVLCLISVDADAATPLELELEPAYFSFPGDSGTFRAGIRWGSITVRGHEGYDVRVAARVIPERGRHQPTAQADLIDLRLEERANIMDLRVASRIEGFYGIELDIAVPRSTRLELEMTDGGEIVVEDVTGEVDVANRNGSVSLAGLGAAAVVDARNGSITASFDQVDPELPMSFSTLNGSIDVTLPGETAASLRIRHTYGGVESDFPLTAATGASVTADLDNLPKGETRVLAGEINGGGPRYAFYTANGTVYLRRASSGGSEDCSGEQGR